MLKTRFIDLSKTRSKAPPVFESLARDAVAAAIAKQKALGLPNFYSSNGRIYGRMPNGRFAAVK